MPISSRDALSLLTRPLDTAAPADTNVLAWDAASGKIKWVAAGGGGGTPTFAQVLTAGAGGGGGAPVDWRKVPTKQASTPYAVLAADSGKTFYGEIGTGTTNFNLPAWAAGIHYWFAHVTSIGDFLNVYAQGADVIACGREITGAAGQLQIDTPYCVVHVEALTIGGVNVWLATGGMGESGVQIAGRRVAQPFVLLTRTTDQVVAAGGALVSWDSAVADTNGLFSGGAPTRFTLRRTGRWLVTGYMILNTTAAADAVGIIHRRGDTGAIRAQWWQDARVGTNPNLTVSGAFNCPHPSDWFELSVYSAAGCTLKGAADQLWFGASEVGT